MTEEKTGPAPTVAFGEQLAASGTVSGVGVPHRPGYMESPSHVHKVTAEEGVAPPQRIKLSEE
jgi:hypothetical protein